MHVLEEIAKAGVAILKKNKSLAAHSTRVYIITQRVLEIDSKLIDNFDREEVLLAALLHDLGKATWLDNYFTEPLALLKPADKYVMDCHPISGKKTAMNLGVPETAQVMIEQHYERPEGRGYPNKIADPLPVSLLIAGVDAYCACLEPRPYRPKPLPLKVALQEAAEKGHNGMVNH